MQDSIASHRDPEMMICDRPIVLKLEDYVDVIALLHIDRGYISIRIEGVNRDGRIIHFLSESGQMHAHYLIYSIQRIFRISIQGLVIDGQMLSIQQYLLFEDSCLISYG